MSFLTGFLVHLPSVLAGMLLIHQILPGNQPSRLVFKLGLGAGLGLGATSLLYFILLLITNSLSGYIFIPITLLGIGLYLTWHNRIQNPIFPTIYSLTKLQKYLLAAFCLLVLTSLGSFMIHALMNSHGGFDAWMIYNRIARFFYRGGINWQNAFSQDIYWQFHADYPLLLPLNLAGAWQTLGTENMRAAQAHGAYIFIGLVSLLIGAVAILRTTGQSLLASIVLLGTPIYVYESPREAADLTLAFFILATVACLIIYHREQNANFLFLAGLASSFGAWTKNEGLLFALISAAACFFLLNKNRRLPKILFYITGLLPLILVLYFKYFLAPSNDLFSSQADLLARITDSQRYITIFQEFIDHFVWFGRSNISIPIILLGYMLILKSHLSSKDSPAVVICAILLTTQFLGYFSIYILTPHNLDWHLRTSLARLIMHLYPAALLLYFASLSDPEPVFTK